MRFEDAVRALEARQPEHMPGPSLDRIRELVAYLDHPERTFPTVHVTGTNGKTTTARVTTTIACAHGLRAGLYTSPHLTSIRERFAVCGEEITEEEFAEEWARLAPVLEVVDGLGHGPVTYFEAATALAFLWFADRPVGVGVIEVGMGGAWDATNVVAGEVAVVCPIGMDHVQQLGPGLVDIAREKAGIIKPGSVAIVRSQEDAAAAVLRARGEEVGATLRWEGEDWAVADRRIAVGGQLVAVRTPLATYDELFLPLHGEHAARNAAAGVAAFEALVERALDEEALRSALADVRTPGRLEVVGHAPLVILDGAHNPAGAQALRTALGEAFLWQRLHVVLAVSADKDLPGICGAIAPIADAVWATRNDTVRSADPDEVAEVCASLGLEVRTAPSVGAALEAARSGADEGDAIVVTGSLFTVADARRALGLA